MLKADGKEILCIVSVCIDTIIGSHLSLLVCSHFAEFLN